MFWQFLALFFLALSPIATHAQPRTPAPLTLSFSTTQAMALITDGQIDRGISKLRQLDRQGDPSATVMLGSMLIKSGRSEEAIQILTPLAEREQADAQFYLAQAYSASKPPDAQQAKRWLLRSAVNGNQTASAIVAAGAPPEPGPDGRVATSAFMAHIEAILVSKTKAFNDKVLACYKASREELLAETHRAVQQCQASLPIAQQDRLLPTTEMERSVAVCLTQNVYDRLHITPEYLARCLPR